MGTRWRGVLAPINQPTGDGRRMAVGSVTHRPLPLPLRWQRPETQGHDDAVVIGSIETIKVDEEAGHVWGEGELFDDVNPATNPQLAEDVSSAKYLLKKKVIGPSVDPGHATAVAVLAGTDDAVTDDTVRKLMMAGAKEMPPTETLFTAYEIAGATLVPVPAFAECRPFELMEAGITAAAVTMDRAESVAALTLRMPPAELFADPKLARITPITRRPLPNGWVHVFGHLAEHGTCLVGQRGVCTTPPYSEREYSHFHRYSDDSLFNRGGVAGLVFPLPLGRLTAGFGALENTCRCCPGNDDHACANISFGAAVAHHDRMQPLAYVRAGEDEQNNAIWFSGIEAPGVDERGQALLARQKISGDWRDVAGGMELSEVLVLNRRNPGFPLPRATMRNGRARALTAAGVIYAPLASQQQTVETAPGIDPQFAIDYDRLGREVAAALIAAAGTPTLEDVIDQTRENLREDAREFEDGNADPEEGVEYEDDDEFEDIDDDELVEDDEIVAITASGVTSLPLAPDGRAWDKGAAVRRLVEWAGDDIAGKYARAFLWQDPDGDPNLQGTYKLPIADIIDGRLTVVPNAVRNAASRLDQVDGMSADARDRVRSMINGLMDRIHDKNGDMAVGDCGEGQHRMPDGGCMPNAAMTAAAAPEGGHTGAMLALRMTDQDAARLCVTDGLSMEELHSTLAYLGDADKISPEVREQMVKDVTKLARKMQPFEVEAADITIFNPGTNNDREPALVLGLTGDTLAELYGRVSKMSWDGYEMPGQFSPYKPHVTLRQPAGDIGRVGSVADRMGPITFDRMRLAFAGDVIDIPLGGGEKLPGGPVTQTGGGYDIGGAESMMGADHELRARAAMASLELTGVLAFNKGQLRGPDGRWIKGGGMGGGVDLDAPSGGGSSAGAGRTKRDDYNKAIHEIALQEVTNAMGGGGDDEDEWDDGETTDLDELDNLASDLEDAMMDGDSEKADQLADRLADLMRDFWSVRDRLPQRPN